MGRYARNGFASGRSFQTDAKPVAETGDSVILSPARLSGANDPAPNSDVVLSTLRGVSDGPLGLVAVFGATSFDVFHVDDVMVDSFEDRDAVRAHISELAQETRRQFVEHGLLTGLNPTQGPNQVRYRTREYRDGQLVEVFVGGRGMLVAAVAEEPVEPLATAAAQLLGGL